MRIVEQTAWIDVDRGLVKSAAAQEPVRVDEAPKIGTCRIDTSTTDITVVTFNFGSLQSGVRDPFFNSGDQGKKISLTHSPPFLIQGHQDAGELTTGHIVYLLRKPYVNADTWSLMQ